MTSGLKEYNHGTKAGKKSGVWDLGSIAHPVAIGPENVLDVFIRMEATAFEDTEIGEVLDVPLYALVRIVPFKPEKIVLAHVKFQEKP